MKIRRRLVVLSAVFACTLCASAKKPLFVAVSELCYENNHNSIEEYYARALERVGCVPFILPKTTNDAVIAAALDHADALVLTGGPQDVDPALYGAARHPKCGKSSAFRDAYDYKLLRHAVERRLPTLGICRGVQIMNVYFGGTLHQHVPDVYGKSEPKTVHSRYSYFGAATNPPTHTVSIVPGTRLAQRVGTAPLAVHSSHHQAVDRVAPGFRVSARSPDGAIEAIEHETLPLAGVQFHLETVVSERPAKGFELDRLEAVFRLLDP